MTVKSVVNSNEAPVTYNGANRQLNVQHSVLPLQKIRAAIRQLSEHGYPRIEQVAKNVGVEQRTLQRRLLAEGTSFTQLVQELRFSLATKLLEDPDVPIASIASTVGFARPSGLSRAFTAWTGTPPRQYRFELLAGSVPSKDTYKYNFKVGNKIVHSGITIDLERRETEHQRRWPNGRIKQVKSDSRHSEFSVQRLLPTVLCRRNFFIQCPFWAQSRSCQAKSEGQLSRKLQFKILIFISASGTKDTWYRSDLMCPVN